MTPPAEPRDEYIARRFHETYERLAPRYGWETNHTTRTPFDDLPEGNRMLMIAVVRELLEEATIL